jgi:hypothetical protein
MIQEHIDEHYPGRDVPYNATTDGGLTVLDYSVEAIKKNKVDEEVNSRLDAQVLAVHRVHAIKCYQMLRENGALHCFELKGIPIMYVTTSQVLWLLNTQGMHRLQYMWTPLPPLEKFISFMNHVTSTYSLGKPKFVPGRLSTIIKCVDGVYASGC